MSARRVVACASWGMGWGIGAWLLGHRALGDATLFGSLAGPAIGVIVGRLFLDRFAGAGGLGRAGYSLAALLVAALLFGLMVGLGLFLLSGGRREFLALVAEGMAGVLFGTALFSVALWPLTWMTMRSLTAAAPANPHAPR